MYKVLKDIRSFKHEENQYVRDQKLFLVNLDEHGEGASQNENFLFYRNDESVTIYDRVCDHNQGKLSLNGSIARCPLHGWELDPSTGQYLNNQCIKEPAQRIMTNELDSPMIELEQSDLCLKLNNYKHTYEVNVEYLNHASLYFHVEKVVSFATDPWLIGPAFQNGWWLHESTRIDAFDKLNSCDFIYISHNHPDHLHEETLKNIRKDMLFLVPKFNSGSTEKTLRSFGFENVHLPEFGTSMVDDLSQIRLSVLKSGDFRDDSGLLVQLGDFSALLTVDSNFLDFGRFPKGITLLCSSFAGGASGFPLCFDDYSEREKSKIILRNKGAIRATNLNNIKKTSPMYFMPYAGFFKEKALRDEYIARNNKKNSPEDYERFCIDNNCELINVLESDELKFFGSNLKKGLYLGEKFPEADPEDYIRKKRYLNYDLTKIKNYFEKSEYEDDLILEVKLTSDDFKDTSHSFTVDFSRSNSFPQFSECILGERPPALRTLELRVREQEFLDVIYNSKPWEDLSIGFQARVSRSPNIYNSKFWNYFTNYYIADQTDQKIMSSD